MNQPFWTQRNSQPESLSPDHVSFLVLVPLLLGCCHLTIGFPLRPLSSGVLLPGATTIPGCDVSLGCPSSTSSPGPPAGGSSPVSWVPACSTIWVPACSAVLPAAPSGSLPAVPSRSARASDAVPHGPVTTSAHCCLCPLLHSVPEPWQLPLSPLVRISTPVFCGPVSVPPVPSWDVWNPSLGGEVLS